MSASIDGCLSHCLSVALRQTGELPRVYPASRPMTAGMGSSAPRDPELDYAGTENGWVDILLVAYFERCWTALATYQTLYKSGLCQHQNCPGFRAAVEADYKQESIMSRQTTIGLT